MKIVTHSGPFHADDVFAISALFMKFGKGHELVRTRDPEIIAGADIVVDVGAVYDEAQSRFDHHQGPPLRPNKIPYASFGLVWKKFGEELAGSKEGADMVDEKLIQPIDAADNSMEISIPAVQGLAPYGIHNAIVSLRPTWLEGEDFDAAFLRAVDIATVILGREIARAQAKIEAFKNILPAYENASDKRILVLDRHYPFGSFAEMHPEILFIVFPDNTETKTWAAKTVPLGESSFTSRKDFPESWAGKRDAELAEATGVPDAVFCHRARFIAVAKSREGAIKLAELAVAA